jgi:methylthioribose-1-phosphate isomerase
VRDPLRALQWEGRTLWILDQRKLPGAERWIAARDVETVAEAIETLAVRGAPAIGIAAAYGISLAAAKPRATKPRLLKAVERLWQTRPTAVNLFYALERMRRVIAVNERDLANRLHGEARLIHREDEIACERMADFGATLFKRGERILTICHTGALATGGIGTALGVIKRGHELGKVKELFACETRPVGQGARLTIWESARAGIPVTLICDNMAASLLALGKVERVLTGADRIARNGDTSNKIGTLNLAILAGHYGIPFHVVAPRSTFDGKIATGRQITIEERSASEVTRITPGLERVRGFKVWNPAFDVTPGELITSFVSETGIMRPPFAPVQRTRST